MLGSLKLFSGSSEGQQPLLSKLFSRKFISTLIPLIGGLVGIDAKLLWGLIAVAGLYIVGNVAQKFIISRKDIIIAQIEAAKPR